MNPEAPTITTQAIIITAISHPGVPTELPDCPYG